MGPFLAALFAVLPRAEGAGIAVASGAVAVGMTGPGKTIAWSSASDDDDAGAAVVVVAAAAEAAAASLSF
jgi:hypothetical protein